MAGEQFGRRTPSRAGATAERMEVIVTVAGQAWRQYTGFRLVAGTATCLVLATEGIRG